LHLVGHQLRIHGQTNIKNSGLIFRLDRRCDSRRLDHHAVSKRRSPITQWHCALSQNAADINWAAAKAYKRTQATCVSSCFLTPTSCRRSQWRSTMPCCTSPHSTIHVKVSYRKLSNGNQPATCMVAAGKRAAAICSN